MEDNPTNDLEFLAEVSELVTRIKEIALEKGVGDRLILIAMIGLKHEELERITSVYDLHSADENYLLEGMDFLDQAVNNEIEESRPEPGTLDWWINKMN